MRRKSMYLGKPLRHWEDQATELVIHTLVKASLLYRNNAGITCLPQDIASKQLMNLAKGINEPMADKLAQQLETTRLGSTHLITQTKKAFRKQV